MFLTKWVPKFHDIHGFQWFQYYNMVIHDLDDARGAPISGASGLAGHRPMGTCQKSFRNPADPLS